MLIAIQFYASGCLLQVVGDTTGADKSIVSLTVYEADAIHVLELKQSNRLSQSPFLWDSSGAKNGRLLATSSLKKTTLSDFLAQKDDLGQVLTHGKLHCGKLIVG